MVVVICGLFILISAVVVCLWIMIKITKQHQQELMNLRQLELKVVQLEQHLQKTLEVMQDMAKNTHQQQIQFEQNAVKLQPVELQNLDVLNVVKQAIQNH